MACGGQDQKIIERWNNNKVKKLKTYINNRDTSQNLIQIYYSNGRLKESTYYFDKMKNGWSVNYYNNGQVKDSIFYRLDIPVTNILHFYHTGKLAFTGLYNDQGYRDGWWKYYDSLGHLIESTEFIGG